MKLAKDALWFGVLTIVIFHIVYLEAAVVKWLVNARRWDEDVQIAAGWVKCGVDRALSAVLRKSDFCTFRRVFTNISY